MTPAEAPRREAGFTLLEVLVALAMAIPLLIALTAILTTTSDQTQRTYTEVSATRQARSALAIVENELHSACVGQNVDPILAGSTPTSMQFLSYNGTDDSPTPVWHVLTFSGGTLTDSTYNVTADPASANVGWDQGSKISSTVLLTNGTALANTPVFAYYAYTPYATGANQYSWIIPDGTNLQPGTTSTYPTSPLNASGSGGLAVSAANSAVEVVISLSAGSAGTYRTPASLAGTSDPVTDSVSLRLTTPPNSTTSSTSTAGANFGPCQ